MKIIGTDGMTVQELQDEVAEGGKFVIYSYCVSIIVLTFRRSSDIYFVKHNQSRFAKGLPWFLISFVFGWWGIPWGIIYTFGSLGNVIGGGKDVTEPVMNFVYSQAAGPVFDFEKDVTQQEAQELDTLKSGLENR
jgi:hypothetical protein